MVRPSRRSASVVRGIPPERLISAAGRFVRWALVSVSVAVALLGALVARPLATLVAAPLLAALAVVILLLAAPRAQQAGPSSRTVALCALGGALVVPLGAGLPLLGSTGAVLLIALLVLGAVLLAERAAQLLEAGAGGVGGSDVARLRRGLPDLPLDVLIRLWRQSAPPVRGDPEPAARTAAADVRSLLLDELSRRDPAGVERWLHAGAGDPGPYLSTGDADRSL